VFADREGRQLRRQPAEQLKDSPNVQVFPGSAQARLRADIDAAFAGSVGLSPPTAATS
jgi:hypothetical protein